MKVVHYQEAGKKIEIPFLTEYKIIILGDDSRGEKELKEYLDEMRNRNKGQFNLQIHKFDIKFNHENFNDKKIEEFIHKLIDLIRILQDGVHLIMICYPIITPRADLSYAGQVYRLLGVECSQNLFAIITEYDKINDKFKYSKTKELVKGLPPLMMKSVMPLHKENIISFDTSNSNNFDHQIMEKLKLLNYCEFKCYSDVNLYKDDLNSKLSSLKQLFHNKENFNRFLNNLTEIKEYIMKYKNENSNKLRLNNVYFKYLSLLCLGLLIWNFRSKLTNLLKFLFYKN